MEYCIFLEFGGYLGVPENFSEKNVLCDLVPFEQLKNMKNTHGGVLFSVKLPTEAYKFTKKHSSTGVFHVFQIVQIVPNRAKHLE